MLVRYFMRKSVVKLFVPMLMLLLGAISVSADTIFSDNFNSGNAYDNGWSAVYNTMTETTYLTASSSSDAMIKQDFSSSIDFTKDWSMQAYMYDYNFNLNQGVRMYLAKQAQQNPTDYLRVWLYHSSGIKIDFECGGACECADSGAVVSLNGDVTISYDAETKTIDVYRDGSHVYSTTVAGCDMSDYTTLLESRDPFSLLDDFLLTNDTYSAYTDEPTLDYNNSVADWWTFDDGDRSGSGNWVNGNIAYDVIGRDTDVTMTGSAIRQIGGVRGQGILWENVLSGGSTGDHFDDVNYPIKENFTMYMAYVGNTLGQTRTIIQHTGHWYMNRRETGTSSSSPVYIDFYVWNGSWNKLPNNDYIYYAGAYPAFTVVREGDRWIVYGQNQNNFWDELNVLVNATATGVPTSGTGNLRFYWLGTNNVGISSDEYGVWNRSLSVDEVKYLTPCRIFRDDYELLPAFGCRSEFYPFVPVSNAPSNIISFTVPATINSTENISVDMQCRDYDGFDNVRAVVTLNKEGQFYDDCVVENMPFNVNSVATTICNFSMSGFFDEEQAEFYAYCTDGEYVSTVLNVNRTVNSLLLPNAEPVVTVSNPQNNSLHNESFDIIFTPTDANNATLDCFLYIDSLLNDTISSVTNNTQQTFSSISIEGIHDFEVVCSDSLANGSSGVYNFLLDTTVPFIASISPVIFNTTVYSNDVMHIYGNTTNFQLDNVSIIISYPNTTVFYENETTSFPDPTTHVWDWTFNTSLMPNGFYEMFIHSSDTVDNTNEKYITFEIANCAPDWQCDGYGVCNISDLSPCNSVTDNNACGQAYTGDYSEFSPQACNYCSYSLTQYNATACINDTQTVCYEDQNFGTCCAVTGLPSDCAYGNESIGCSVEACTFEEAQSEGDDVANALIDLIVKFILSVNNLIP